MDRAWPGGVEQEGRALVERLGGAWGANGGMCRCPAHDDRTPSLSVRPGRRRLLFHCFAGCAAADILRLLEAQHLLVPRSFHPPLPAGPCRAVGPSAAARRIWSEARSIHGTMACAYLESRSIRAGSPELRYHPRTPHGPAPLTCYRPALVAAVRDETGLVAIHRTFLERPSPGLAPVAPMRRGLGSYGRGAVRLGGVARRLGLAEGIETALSAAALFGLPCWATLGSQRLAKVFLPPEVEELVLFLDHDVAGRSAERRARGAFAHLPRIRVRYPQAWGEDWNDVLRSSSMPAGA